MGLQLGPEILCLAARRAEAADDEAVQIQHRDSASILLDMIVYLSEQSGASHQNFALIFLVINHKNKKNKP